ncbi:MAG: radical SAM protein [Candidatus Aureabacteria bacterium]|nr:radical SAM protein [Candidatus Auribacterota bacterium]
MNSLPLALSTLASLTPPDVEVAILDENIQDIDYAQPADLVGITVMLHLAPQAIRIAREFRGRGVPVVMGGFYPTLWPEKALPHADAIAIGEGEPLWRQILDDARGGKLKPRYQSSGYIDLKDIPFISKGTMRHLDFYHTETSRGCPHKCDFCSVAKFYQGTVRQRPIKDVVAQVAEFADKLIFFVDDNIAGNRIYVKKLLREFIPLNISWSGQFTLDGATDAEFLKLAAQSGCKFLFCGIETLSKEGLREVNKSWAKPENYREWIRRIHDAGIAVYGSFMFGFEFDHKDVFKKTLEFAEETKIELALFSALFPIEGSQLYQKLKQENRLFEKDLSKYNGQYATFYPKHMSPEELDEGLRWIWQQFYSKAGIKKRIGQYFPAIARMNKPLESMNYREFSMEELMLLLNMAFKIAVTDF